MNNVKQLLPKGSREIIIKALKTYQHSLDIIGNGFDENMNNEHFDCYGLIGMMDYDVEVTLSKQDVEDFGQHNVDFPMFGEVKRKYPTKEESEWVTIIKGDFSFVDDGVHGRECYVNNIVSIEKHLRYDMGQVIDEIENDGFGYVVVEDYDGSIEMNGEDKREYLIVNSMVDSVRRQTYAEMKETDGDIMDRIDLIEVGETGARNDGEVYYIRVK